MPGRLDEESSGMPITGLRDRPERPRRSRGVLGGDQAHERADRRSGEAIPVADFDREAERGQRRDPTKALEPADESYVFAVRSELLDGLV